LLACIDIAYDLGAQLVPYFAALLITCSVKSLKNYTECLRRRSLKVFFNKIHRGGATASHRLPTAVARARSLVGSCKIVGLLSVAEADLLRPLRFPLPVVIPPTAPYSLILLSWTLCSLDADSVVK
jgi:hypothetical protein